LNDWDRGQKHISLAVVRGTIMVHCGQCGAQEPVTAIAFMEAMRQARRARDRHLRCAASPSALDHRRGNVRRAERPTPGTTRDARSVA
jgi:hypothetical protein